MVFLVESLNNKKQRAYSFKEADNLTHLFDLLKKNNVIALSTYKLPDLLNILFLDHQIRLKPDEIIEIINSLYLIVKSGLPLHSGLMDLAADSDNEKFKKVLISIADDVNKGKSLSQAFSKFKKSFNPMILSLIHTGEEMGQLQTTLERGVVFLKRTLSLKKRVKQALIYPSFAFITIFSAMLVWLLYVLPQLTDLFKQMNIVLPPLTLFIIALSDFVNDYITHMLGGVFFIIVTFKFLHNRYQKVKYKTDQLLLRIPLVKSIISSFNMAFIAEYLRLAMISGIPFYSALETLKTNTRNEVYKKAVDEVMSDISEGHQLSVAFKKTGVFAPFMIRMMSTGEASGTLDSQFNLVSEHYNEKVDYYAENISKTVEPIILIIAGGFMALIMVGLMGPMYDIITQMK